MSVLPAIPVGQLAVANGLRIGASVLGNGLALEIGGASVVAASAGTVILATGVAAALVLFGYAALASAKKAT